MEFLMYLIKSVVQHSTQYPLSYWHSSSSFSVWLDLESLRQQTWGSLFKGGLTGKIHPSCGQHHLLCWGSGRNKKEKAGYHVHPCLLLMNRHDVTSGLLFLPLCLPPPWNYPQNVRWKNPFFLQAAFVWYFFFNSKKKRHTHLACSFLSHFRLDCQSLHFPVLDIL